MADETFDTTKTAKKVRSFFNNDFQLYLNRANLHRNLLKDLDEPAKKDRDEVEYNTAKCYVIYQTIMNCEENKDLRVWNKTILYDRYILQLEDQQIAERISISQSRYREKKRSALCEFADRLQAGAKEYDLTFPNIRVFKK